DNRLLARLERTIQIGRHRDIVGNEARAAKRSLQFWRKLDQNDARAGFGRRLLDLCEALRRRRIDAGDPLEVENQEAAIPLLGEQRLDVLIKTIGGSEEQIALQRHALDFPPVRRQERELVRPPIKRRAVFRAVETELDGVHAADAERKG